MTIQVITSPLARATADPIDSQQCRSEVSYVRPYLLKTNRTLYLSPKSVPNLRALMMT